MCVGTEGGEDLRRDEKEKLESLSCRGIFRGMKDKVGVGMSGNWWEQWNEVDVVNDLYLGFYIYAT